MVIKIQPGNVYVVCSCREILSRYFLEVLEWEFFREKRLSLK